MPTKKVSSKTSSKASLNLNLNVAKKPSKRKTNKAKKQLKKLGATTILLVFVFVAIGVAIGFFGIKFITKNDCFEMVGPEEITAFLGSTYKDQGVKIISLGKDYSNEAIIETNLTKNSDGSYSAEEEGTYYISYSVDNLIYGKLFKIKKVRLVTFVEPSESDELLEVEV